jgi:hypothetical protein
MKVSTVGLGRSEPSWLLLPLCVRSVVTEAAHEAAEETTAAG